MSFQLSPDEAEALAYEAEALAEKLEADAESLTQALESHTGYEWTPGHSGSTLPPTHWTACGCMRVTGMPIAGRMTYHAAATVNGMGAHGQSEWIREAFDLMVEDVRHCLAESDQPPEDSS